MNITDVGHLVSDEDTGEDKLEKGARREGTTAWEVAKMYSENFVVGMKKLNLMAPQYITRATDYIPQQLELVRTLHDKGYTYQIDDGIYFDVSRFPSYADFAGLDLDAQKAGARVEHNDQKRNPSDFALWKFSPVGEKRDMEWATPADILDIPSSDTRIGFPGWHLECSAMAMDIFGPTLDIHTGGIDHIPVHHTNEIAQSEAATGQQFSRFWLHNNHLKVNGTKISKSLGNGHTLDDLKEKGYSPLDFRMFVLQGHYAHEGNFTFENLTSAQNRLHRWKTVAALRHQIHSTLENSKDTLSSDDSIDFLAAPGALKEALCDNLNTPKALQIIDEAFARITDKNITHLHRPSFVALLETIDATLGLSLQDSTPDISNDAKQLIVARLRAREAKDWSTSDALRTSLEQMGVCVRDTANGSFWEPLS